MRLFKKPGRAIQSEEAVEVKDVRSSVQGVDLFGRDFRRSGSERQIRQNIQRIRQMVPRLIVWFGSRVVVPPASVFASTPDLGGRMKRRRQDERSGQKQLKSITHEKRKRARGPVANVRLYGQ